MNIPQTRGINYLVHEHLRATEKLSFFEVESPPIGLKALRYSRNFPILLAKRKCWAAVAPLCRALSAEIRMSGVVDHPSERWGHLLTSSSAVNSPALRFLSLHEVFFFLCRLLLWIPSHKQPTRLIRLTRTGNHCRYKRRVYTDGWRKQGVGGTFCASVFLSTAHFQSKQPPFLFFSARGC